MCIGDWEHTYGITIETIDNPGWSLEVELADTPLYEKKFQDLKIQRDDEDDWVIVKVIDGNFIGYGGPQSLEELINIFLEWASDNEE